MNWFSFLVLYFSSFTSLDIHDVQLSQFELSQSQRELVLTINVEQADLFRSWKAFKNKTLNEKKAEVNDYLQRKTSWLINKNSFSICNYNLVQEEGHFLIRGYLINVPEQIEHIYFRNEFLMEEIFGHLNIIHFNLNQQLRSFKMDKNRQEITFDFN